MPGVVVVVMPGVVVVVVPSVVVVVMPGVVVVVVPGVGVVVMPGVVVVVMPGVVVVVVAGVGVVVVPVLVVGVRCWPQRRHGRRFIPLRAETGGTRRLPHGAPPGSCALPASSTVAGGRPLPQPIPER